MHRVQLRNHNDEKMKIKLMAAAVVVVVVVVEPRESANLSKPLILYINLPFLLKENIFIFNEHSEGGCRQWRQQAQTGPVGSPPQPV